MRGLFGSRFHRSSESFSLRLNGLTKIGLCIAMSIITLILGDIDSLSLLLFGSFAFAITQIRFKVLFIVYLLVGIMGAISVSFALLLSTILEILKPGSMNYGMFTMLPALMRVLIVMQTVIVTALSTSPQEILLNLKSIKLPRCLYLPVLVMLRFIPSFINDLRQIRESLKTRGLRITPLSIMAHPVLTMRCSVFPLIFRALRSSDELAIASELKGVGYVKHVTTFKRHLFRFEDVVMLMLVLMFFTCSFRVYWDAPQGVSGRPGTKLQTGREKVLGLVDWVLTVGDGENLKQNNGTSGEDAQ